LNRSPQGKMDNMLNKLRDFNVDIPGVGAAAKKIGSLLADVIEQMPIRRLAEEFVTFYTNFRNSLPNATVSNGITPADVSAQLGLMNNAKSFMSVLRRQKLQEKYYSFRDSRPGYPRGAKRSMLSTLKVT
jgi:hypothetical protein